MKEQKNFSPEEDNTIRTMLLTEATYAEIAQALSRQISSVHFRARKLGLANKPAKPVAIVHIRAETLVKVQARVEEVKIPLIDWMEQCMKWGLSAKGPKAPSGKYRKRGELV